MPEVHVFAAEGRTPEQKKALMKDITDAVVKNFGAPADAVVVTDGAAFLENGESVRVVAK